MRYFSYLLTAISLILIAFLSYQSYTYLYTTGYGLHPGITAGVSAVLFACIYSFLAYPFDDEVSEEDMDITNDIFVK